jgi:hypothetical protein
MKDVLRPYVPEYKGHVTCEDGDCILVIKTKKDRIMQALRPLVVGMGDWCFVERRVVEGNVMDAVFWSVALLFQPYNSEPVRPWHFGLRGGAPSNAESYATFRRTLQMLSSGLVCWFCFFWKPCVGQAVGSTKVLQEISNHEDGNCNVAETMDNF